MYKCIRICIYTWIHGCIWLCLHLYIYLNSCMYINVLVYVHLHVFMHVYQCVCICINTCINARRLWKFLTFGADVELFINVVKWCFIQTVKINVDCVYKGEYLENMWLHKICQWMFCFWAMTSLFLFCRLDCNIGHNLPYEWYMSTLIKIAWKHRTYLCKPSY